MESKSRMYKVSEVADILNVSPHSVLRWIHEGEITALKLPVKEYRISEEEVMRIMSKILVRKDVNDDKN